MNIPHQNNKIKDVCNCRTKKYCSLGGKCLSSITVYQGKITSSHPNYTKKVYFGIIVQKIVMKNRSKIPCTSSSTAPYPLLMKITQNTQNCQKNTRKLKGATLFQRERGAS